jgi:hypothetical protein
VRRWIKLKYCLGTISWISFGKEKLFEHIRNLGTLPNSGFKFFAVPTPVKGMVSFPVRAFAIID